MLKVSILIPLYNSEKYIAETIQNALNQTWINKEIVIVDDQSTDQSYEIAKSYESNIVKVYRNPKKGACAARNYAFDISTGDYIQYLDADDLLPADKIEKQLSLIKNNDNTSIVFCAWSHFWTDIKEAKLNSIPIYKNYHNPGDLLYDMITKNLMVTNHAWLTPRSIINSAGAWDEKLLINQDGEFFTRVILASNNIYYCPEIMVYYRLIQGVGITRNLNQRKIFSEFDALKKINNHILNYAYISHPKVLVETNTFRFIVKAYFFDKEIIKKLREYINDLHLKYNIDIFTGQFKFAVQIFGFWHALKLIKFFRNLKETIKNIYK